MNRTNNLINLLFLNITYTTGYTYCVNYFLFNVLFLKLRHLLDSPELFNVLGLILKYYFESGVEVCDYIIDYQKTRDQIYIIFLNMNIIVYFFYPYINIFNALGIYYINYLLTPIFHLNH